MHLTLLSLLLGVFILITPSCSFALDSIPTGLLERVEEYQLNQINKVTVYTTEGLDSTKQNIRTTMVDFSGYSKLGIINSLKEMAYARATLVTNAHFNPTNKFNVFLRAINASNPDPNVEGYDYQVAWIAAGYFLEPDGQGGWRMQASTTAASLDPFFEISSFLCIKKSLSHMINGTIPNTALAKMIQRNSVGVVTNIIQPSNAYMLDTSLTNRESGDLSNAWLHNRLVIRKTLVTGSILGEIEMQYADGATRSYRLETGEQLVLPINITLVLSNNVPNISISGNSNETAVVEYATNPVFGPWIETRTFLLSLGDPKTNYLDSVVPENRRFYRVRYQ